MQRFGIVKKCQCLGDFQARIYPQAQDFCSISRREKGRIASYATLFTTQKADKKTCLWVNSAPEIALVLFDIKNLLVVLF